MDSKNGFDHELAHRHFSVACFNATWELIDKKVRTPADDAEMLLRAMTSLWHWTQRSDCTGRNLSIGYWQVSRVLAILRHGELARQFGALCLEHSDEEDHFCRGYAYESLARAASVLRRTDDVSNDISAATDHASKIEDADDRQQLQNDLNSIPRTTH